jgi:hypothetical protein
MHVVLLSFIFVVITFAISLARVVRENVIRTFVINLVRVPMFIHFI